MTISVDAIQTNAMERALASDEQLRETLAGRTLAEAMRARVGLPTFNGYQLGTDATLFQMTTRARVFGLPIVTITSAPRQLQVGPGVLMADAGAEVAGVDDSTFRVGLSLAATTNVVIPAADDLWHLLECRVVNQDVTESRDILTNVVTRTYAPSVIVKRKLKRLAFQIITGTASALPAGTAGWTPLYGFVIPTGGGTIPIMSQLVDLRPSSQQVADRTENEEDGAFRGVSRVLSRKLTTNSTLTSASQGAAFELTAEVDGVFLKAHTVNGSVDISRFIVGGAAPVASTWYYAYLAPSPISTQCGNALYAGRIENVVSNCVLLLSTSPPRADGRNSATLACVAPFGGTNIAIGTAVCAGVLLQNSSANGWAAMTCTAAGKVKIASPLLNGSGILPASFGAVVAGSTTWTAAMPLHMVRTVDMQFGMRVKTPSQGAGGTNGKIMITGGAQGIAAVLEELGYGSVLIDPLIQEDFKSLTIPCVGAGVLASPTGNVELKIGTRDPTGVVYVSPGFLNQVCVNPAQVAIRVTGFDM